MKSSSIKYIHRLLLTIFILFSLVACDKKPETGITSTPAVQAANPAVTAGIGAIEYVQVNAEGYGTTAAIATSDAIRSAIVQVNGMAVDMQSQRYSLALNVVSGKSEADIRATGLAEAVSTSSGGVVKSMKILDVNQSTLSQQYKIKIEATIAKYAISESESKKLKIVVMPPKFKTSTVNIAGIAIPSTQIAADIQQQITAALNNTGRVIVLDRQNDDALFKELDMIASGETRMEQITKLGQTYSADLIWTGTITALNYDIKLHKAKDMFDDDRITQGGGWSMVQKLVNVPTRQIVNSDINAAAINMQGMQGKTIVAAITQEIANRAVLNILMKTFPIAIAQIEGNTVILNQGSSVIKDKHRYGVVVKGAPIKDPQTGIVLGYAESPCCEIMIDRTTPTLSYGHFENLTLPLEKLIASQLQVKDDLGARMVVVLPSKAMPKGAIAAPAQAAKKPAPAPTVEPIPAKTKDTNW